MPANDFYLEWAIKAQDELEENEEAISYPITSLRDNWDDFISYN